MTAADDVAAALDPWAVIEGLRAELAEAERRAQEGWAAAHAANLNAAELHEDLAVLRAAGGQEKPNDERARVLAILADKCNHRGIRSSDFTKDGHCVDCMTLLDALVPAAPVGGQAEPEDYQRTFHQTTEGDEHDGPGADCDLCEPES